MKIQNFLTKKETPLWEMFGKHGRYHFNLIVSVNMIH